MTERKGLHKDEILITEDTSAWQILKVLANKGPLNVKGITKVTKLEYAYCHKRVKILLKSGLAEVREKRRARGQEMSFYDLTLLGLCLYLTQTSFQDLDKFAARYTCYIPHVFGEWSYFTEKDVKDTIIRNLTQTMSAIVRRAIILKDSSHTLSRSLEEEIEEGTLCPWIIPAYLGFWQEDEWNAELQKAIKQSSNLWEYMQPKLAQAVKQTQELLNRLNMILK